MRVGVGFDAHPLVAGRKLILGGVEVPYHMGLSGHSDGDVLVHAIIDALLGAAGLGDKGTYFPSDEQTLQGVSSLALLSKVRGMILDCGWAVGNVDVTLVAEHPRLNPYVARMSSSVARTLGTESARVSVKVTSGNGLAFGRGLDGIAAYAVALLESRPAS